MRRATPRIAIYPVIAAKAKTETHFFEEGGHGYGIGPDHAPAGLWPALFAAWLDRALS